MKIRIRLANGYSLERDFSAESIKGIEKSKEFKKVDRKGLKQDCNYGYFDSCEYCFGAKKKKCEERRGKRLDLLKDYVLYLQNYK